MAAEALGGESPTLFLRKATGLVRGWSVRDSMIYACLSTNVVTLGIYEMSFQSFFPKGQLLTAVLISGVWVSFLVIAYAGLVVTIPRAGGDYVWQTRILGSGIGFVMAATGWWFILWLWAPIYGNVLSVEFFQPLLATLGHPSAATWFGGHTGVFVITIITIVLAGLLVSLGMNGYARIQKWGFYGGLVGFAVILILLAVNNHTDFINSFNLEAQKIFGVHNAFQATNAGAAKSGYVSPAFGFSPVSASMLLVPMMMFYLLWPNWGSTLYGEIRGASDFRRVFAGMFGGLWITVLLSVLFLVLVNKTMGTAFYNNSNALYWEAYYGGKVPSAIPIWPYPVMFIGWMVHNTVFQVALIVVMLLWFVAWVGTLFLSSTRVIFAAAFDRILPDRAAEVSEKRKVPFYSLVLMLLPAVGLAALYAYNTTFAVLHAGRDAGHRGDLPVHRDRRRPAAVHQEGPLAGVPGEPGQAVRGPDRAAGRLGHHRPARLQPVRVAHERQLRRQQQGFPVLHGRHVPSRAHHLRGGADRPQPAGDRPRPDQQGNPGRVTHPHAAVPRRPADARLQAASAGRRRSAAARRHRQRFATRQSA